MESTAETPIRIAPELLADATSLLRPDETLAQFVERAVRSAVRSRRVHMEFHARGQAAWEHYQRTGESFSVDEVVEKLQAKVDARRKQLGL